jgi:hypothetical protein
MPKRKLRKLIQTWLSTNKQQSQEDKLTNNKAGHQASHFTQDFPTPQVEAGAGIIQSEKQLSQ